MLAVAGMMTGCDDTSKAQGVGWTPGVPAGTMPPGFDSFPERWNKRNKAWLEGQIAELSSTAGKQRQIFLTTEDEQEKKAIEKDLAETTRTLEMMQTRLQEGDYVQFRNPDEIPHDLVWEDGLDNPEIGDPAAKKGGSIRLCEPGSNPSTFREFGPNSTNGYRGRLYDEIDMSFVALHPVTGRIIPGIARQWAIGPDGRTVFFRLFDDVTYSDGVKLNAIDFVVGMYLRTSEYSQSLYHENYFRESVSHITVYDDKTLSVTLPTPKPLLPFYASVFLPSPPHFYSEFGPNFTEKYQWRVPPTAGAYTADADNVVRGRTMVMKRVRDWWARDKKFYRYRNNVDQIVYNFIAEESKAQELFRTGEIDSYLMVKPEVWYDRMEIPEVHNGYIQRSTFFTVYPRPPIGIYLNAAKAPFNDINVRLGLHHAMNIQKVIDVIYRGDYQRLGSYASGYGRYTDASIKAREFSPEKAREYFARAGYTVVGPDNILRKPDGTRLAAELTFSNTSLSLSSIMSLLKEDCRKCGFDLQLDSLDSTVSYRKVMEKRHQAAFWAWGFTPPLPSLYQGFYSGYAYDEKGNPKPYTNNITSYSSPLMDKLVMDERDAHTEDEYEKVSHAIQQLIHKEGVWIPGWTTEFIRIGYWRWVRWPDSETTRFCYPLVYEPMESYLYWIDEDIKEETLKAKRDGVTFSEVDRVYDQYRFRSTLDEESRNDSSLPSVPVMIPPLELSTETQPADHE